jgi:hypothetical protein
VQTSERASRTSGSRKYGILISYSPYGRAKKVAVRPPQHRPVHARPRRCSEATLYAMR